MAFQGNFTREFTLRVLKRLKVPMKTIAFHLGIPYNTYRNWREGLYAFPPDLLSELYKVTKDRRIFDFFLHPAGFVALEDPDGKGRELIENAAKALKELWEFMDYEREEKG